MVLDWKGSKKLNWVLSIVHSLVKLKRKITHSSISLEYQSFLLTRNTLVLGGVIYKKEKAHFGAKKELGKVLKELSSRLKSR